MPRDSESAETFFAHRVVNHPGVLLREARESAGIGQRELAEELYLTLHYVQALEQGDFARLPGSTFVRGYLRSYARRVGLSEQRVIEQYEEYQKHNNDTEGGRRRRGEPGTGRDGMVYLWYGLGAVLVLLVMLGIFAAWTSEEAPVSEAAPGTAPEVAAAASTADRLTAHPGPESVLAPDQDGLRSRRAAVREVQPGQEPEARAVESEPEPAGAAEGPDSAALVMHFYADCWVQVKDASGTTLAFGVKRAGEALSMEGEAPYSVRIGNVAAVKLLFNGAEVDLGAYARNNIANFVLN